MKSLFFYSFPLYSTVDNIELRQGSHYRSFKIQNQVASHTVRILTDVQASKMHTLQDLKMMALHTLGKDAENEH